MCVITTYAAAARDSDFLAFFFVAIFKRFLIETQLQSVDSFGRCSRIFFIPSREMGTRVRIDDRSSDALNGAVALLILILRIVCRF